MFQPTAGTETEEVTEGQLTASVWRPLVSHDQVDSGRADMKADNRAEMGTNIPERINNKSDDQDEWECDVCHDINKGWTQNCQLCWRAKSSALLSSSKNHSTSAGPYFPASTWMDGRSMIVPQQSAVVVPSTMTPVALPYYPTIPSYAGHSSHLVRGYQGIQLDELGMPLTSSAIDQSALLVHQMPKKNRKRAMSAGKRPSSKKQKKAPKPKKKKSVPKTETKKPKVVKVKTPKLPRKPKPPKKKHIPKPKPPPKPPKLFKCPDCEFEFLDSRTFRAHAAQHKWGPHAIETNVETKVTRFLCLHPGCKKIVKDRKVLRKHLLTHCEKQFVCHYEGCGKKFYERAKLKRHFLVHTGDKPFKCPYKGCNKPFGYKANLKTHMRTHTGQRPFACTFPGCDRRFAQASNRNSHVLTHQKGNSDSGASVPSSTTDDTKESSKGESERAGADSNVECPPCPTT